MNPNKTRDFTPPFSQDLAGTTPFTKKPRRPSLGDQGPWRPAPPVSLPPQVEPGTSQRVSRWNSWNLWNLSVYPLAEPPGNPSENPIVSAHEDLFLRNQCFCFKTQRFFLGEIWYAILARMPGKHGRTLFCGQQPEEKKWECSNVCSFETSSSSQ